MENLEELTQIAVTKQTRERIKEYGKKGETYDEILNKLLDKIENKESAPSIEENFNLNNDLNTNKQGE